MPYITKVVNGKEVKLKAKIVVCAICKQRFAKVNCAVRKVNYCTTACKNMAFRGKGNPFFKGGRYKHTNGYIYVSDARSKSGYVAEHRIIMEQHLGRPLERWEIVHHKNRNTTDNRIENLELVSHCHNGNVETELKKEIKRLQGILEGYGIEYRRT